MGRLDGKVAIVTGGAQGMGAATARLFAAEGARVVIGDVIEDKGAEVATEIGDNARFSRLDVRSEDDWAAAVSAAFTADQVVNGRFKGGWTTRHYGQPANGVHAIQMELAIRGYAPEPPAPDEANWPPAFDPASAAPLAATLRNVLNACLDFAQ